MREIEAEINNRRNEPDRPTEIPLTNYRGIELRDFPAEIARLALIIAEYQCDLQYRGKKLALAEFLPLDSENWITSGNALKLDWLSVCPPTGTSVKLMGDDLFETPLDQAEIDFENEGGETYICGNPPYVGSTWQTPEQKDDLGRIFEPITKNWRTLDYVSGWFLKAANYGTNTNATSAFVATNSICQGQQVPILWPEIFSIGHEIVFAHTSFKWANLASNNAGVTVIIVGISNKKYKNKRLYSINNNGETEEKIASNINAYLVDAIDVAVKKRTNVLSNLGFMESGAKATDGSNLIIEPDIYRELVLNNNPSLRYVRFFQGSAEFIRGNQRYCVWLSENEENEARKIDFLAERFDLTKESRLKSTKKNTREVLSKYDYKFEFVGNGGNGDVIIVPAVSSEARGWLPCGILPKGSIVSNLAFALYDSPLWNLAIIASELHLVWIKAVCGQLETRIRYSNTIGWNTFPVPKLTEKNKSDLSKAAEDILLAREAHFPATIADLYNPETMPENLRFAHKRNDEVLERIYIGREFKNDTERLEKLFDLYTQMTEKESSKNTKKANPHGA
jgi:hypothetical protein